MENTFLLELWSGLFPQERRTFLSFLDNPQFNQRADVKKLAGLLAQTREGEWGVLDKKQVFEQVFPGAPYDNLRFNYTCSFLARLLEAFFFQQEMQQEPVWREWFLCKALRRRGVNRHFLRKTTQLAQTLEQQPLRNAGYHLTRYLLESERYQYRVLHEREAPTTLTNVTGPLHHFFTLENLRWAGTALALQARYGARNPLPLAAEVLANAASADPEQLPEIAMLHLGYLTLSDTENEENFLRLKNLIAEKSHLFSAAEIRDLYLSAINFCLRRHNRGERPQYTREALDLYRAVLEKGLLFENGVLQKFTYNNILRLASGAGEREWALRFLEDYQRYLPAEDRANTFRFNLACWHYLGREYARVPELLQTFDFADRDTQLTARQMLLRSYFELQEWTALDSLLKSFYSFLRRRHDIGYQRLMYLNLIKYTRKLIGGPLSKRKAAALAERIKAEPYVAEREWLLGRL